MTRRVRLEARAVGMQAGRASRDLPTRTAALTALGALVYAIRVNGLIKIGHTTNLARRLSEIRCREGDPHAELLAFVPGSLDEEQALHACLAPDVVRGREYYFPSEAVIEAVNAMRAVLALPPIECDHEPDIFSAP